MTSFFSDRTAELAAIAPLTAHLSEHFVQAIPIRFSSTREGTKTSRILHADIRMRVVAIFVKRPKMETDGRLHARINHSICDYAKEAIQFGIPTFAGVPEARSILDLAHSCPVHWISLDSNGSEELIVNFTKLGGNPQFTRSMDALPLQCITLAQMSEAIETRAAIGDWKERTAALSEVRRQAESQTGHYPFFRSHVPTHVLLPIP